jgi:hypothetical protein
MAFMNKVLILLLFFCILPRLQAVEKEHKVDFDKDIQPILSDKCFHCHGPDAKTREGKLRLDTFEGATAKRKRGAAVIPGKAMDSDLIRRMITDDEDDLMPPSDSNRHVSKEQIELLKRWIDQGATWSEHWAFRKPSTPTPPAVGKTWANNPVDNFIYQKLSHKNLKPNPQADKRTLLRRLSLDLTGLPPTPEEINLFLADNSPQAYEKQVDRLLKSPHYGERMAWPWLEAARYSDTNGYQGDNTRTMWPWRDWVVKAFNQNMPFDQFTIEQIAGDMLPNATLDQKLATAFLRNHMINGEGGRIAEENRVEYVFDQLETVGTIFLGLTFNCCRCHDHKYDPLSHKDYYSFSAFFNQTPVTGASKSGQTAPTVTLPAAADVVAKHQQILKVKKGQLKALEEKILLEFKASQKASTAPLKTNVLDPKKKQQFLNKNKDYQSLKKQVTNRLRAITRLGTRVMAMQDNQQRQTFVLNTGLYNQREEEVTPNVPHFLPQLPKGVKADRLALANWIVSKKNPLTSRVTINRLWAQVFGTGLIKTTENFGIQGERPKNPELLDWLATEFIRSQWNVKHMMRLMVTSATYKQAATFSARNFELDPYNRYLGRGPRYRMPSWMIRDQALHSSGLINKQRGGQGVLPYQPAGIWADMSFGKIRYQQDKGAKLYRRSIYTFWRRIVSPTMFFDSAKRQICEVKEKRTNTPLHALVTMNDTAYVEAGRALAVKAMQEKSSDAIIQKMVSLVLARKATSQELHILKGMLQTFTKKYQKQPALAADYLTVGEFRIPSHLNKIDVAALANLGLALLNLDESLTRE